MCLLCCWLKHAIFIVSFRVFQDDLCCLSAPDDKPELQHLINQWYPVHTLIKVVYRKVLEVLNTKTNCWIWADGMLILITETQLFSKNKENILTDVLSPIIVNVKALSNYFLASMLQQWMMKHAFDFIWVLFLIIQSTLNTCVLSTLIQIIKWMMCIV